MSFVASANVEKKIEKDEEKLDAPDEVVSGRLNQKTSIHEEDEIAPEASSYSISSLE